MINKNSEMSIFYYLCAKNRKQSHGTWVHVRIIKVIKAKTRGKSLFTILFFFCPKIYPV